MPWLSRPQLPLLPGLRAEVHALESILVGEKESVVEGKPGVDAVTQRDMAEFVGQSHRQRAPSSGRTSSKPRLITMVWPMVKDSSGEVSSTRQRTSGMI